MMTEREYYEIVDMITHDGDCEKCGYSICGDCHLQCDKPYETYIKELEKHEEC